ncbi:hypothetical protein [Flavobacterium agrisoli]|uniref:Adhesin domain-containing protein n=1 Tax=Flavobacterium agrisoli TaxID=2793066 RepID=A0A934PK37_9FLAO|nr:hypothetical protein [Flavobacterium agrisoli]MBK0368814.1 hypothetical protein [Flavobacterium agrisoli]
MKKAFALLILLFALAPKLVAQSPEKMSYQAIVRAQDNSLVVSSKIGMKISVLQGSTSGIIVYQETHFKTTNSNGLVSLEIGTGSVITGDFSKIAWEKGPYFIETQVDVKGGSSYNIIGSTQLLSVPYALHAKTAERLIGGSTGGTSRAAIISVKASRNMASTDINNTIECTTSSTLTLTPDFGSMLVGDTINLEAHNGAILTIKASSGVNLNYNLNGSAIFTSETGNVRFGMLRKTGTNSYIISGQ